MIETTERVDQVTKDTFAETSEDAPTNQEKTTTQQKDDFMMKKAVSVVIKKAVFLALLISIAVSCLTVAAYDRFFSKLAGKDIVAIDVKGYLSDQQDLYITGKLTEKQFKANLDHLERFVKSVPKNKIILMGDAVVGGNIEVLKP